MIVNANREGGGEGGVFSISDSSLSRFPAESKSDYIET